MLHKLLGNVIKHINLRIFSSKIVKCTTQSIQIQYSGYLLTLRAC